MTDTRQSASQERTWLPVAGAAALAVLIVLGIVLANLGGSDDDFSLATSATIPSGHAAEAVIHDGDTVRGSGTVVAAPDGPHFCAPVVSAGSGDGGGCRLWVRAVGAKPGSATLTGTFRNGVLTVTDQRPYKEPRSDRYGYQPPCGAPEDGWPEGSVQPGAAERYKRDHPDTVELIAIMAITRGHEVQYVVTDGDPNPAGDALSPVYGDHLCVVRGKYSEAQIDAAKKLVDREIGTGIEDFSEGGGPEIDHQGNLSVAASVPLLTAKLAAAVDAQPAGLLQLDVWLRPTG